MSEELIRPYRDQIDRLNRESAGRRKKLGEAKAERETLAKKLAAAEKERDEWKGKAETPTAHTKRIAELEGEIRTRTHKDAFARAVTAKGGRPEAVEALWAVSGYKPEGEPDEAAIGELVGTLATGHAYAFTKAGETPADRKSLPPGPGSSRGSSAGAGGRSADSVVVRKADMEDSAYMMNSANYKRIAEAEKAGKLVISDD